MHYSRLAFSETGQSTIVPDPARSLTDPNTGKFILKDRNYYVRSPANNEDCEMGNVNGPSGVDDQSVNDLYFHQFIISSMGKAPAIFVENPK